MSETQTVVKRVAVIGSGVMGKQIAMLLALNGISVTVIGRRPEGDFLGALEASLQLPLRMKQLKADDVVSIRSGIEYSTNMADAGEADFVMEAVVEDLAAKRRVLSNLDEHLGDDVIVGTNTSSLSITEMGSTFRKPARFLGVHFFNPILAVSLVEVVRGMETSDACIERVVVWLRQIKKFPVVMPESPGFVVNRLLFPMINEAIFLLSEGISDARTIDLCIKRGLNHPMGPIELADFIGLDICLQILECLFRETGDVKYRPAPMLRKYVRAGRLGRKTGSGFFTYRQTVK